MKALLTIGSPTGLLSRVGVPERAPVLNFVGSLPPGSRVFNLGRTGDLSLKIRNDGIADDDDENLLVELLDGNNVVVQRNVVYPEREFVLPVAKSVTNVRLTNPALLGEGIPLAATVF